MSDMSDEPNLPPIPSIGDILTRKDNEKEFKTTIIECIGCGKRTEKPFQEGEFVFKIFEEKPCEKCSKTQFRIVEIFAEYKKVKKQESKIGKKVTKKPKKEKRN